MNMNDFLGSNQPVNQQQGGPPCSQPGMDPGAMNQMMGQGPPGGYNQRMAMNPG